MSGRTFGDIAALIAARVPRRNPIPGGVIVADLGLVNGTQQVSVLVGGATRTAIYLSPLAVEVPGNVFVTRAGAELDAPLIVFTTNYQVPVTSVEVSGLGTGGLGTGPLGL